MNIYVDWASFCIAAERWSIPPSLLYAPNFFGLNQHIVDVYLHVVANLVFEHSVYQSLICGSIIFQSERHDLVTIESHICSETFMLFVWGMHGYLVVSRVGVHEVKDIVTHCSIDQMVNPR